MKKIIASISILFACFLAAKAQTPSKDLLTELENRPIPEKEIVKKPALQEDFDRFSFGLLTEMGIGWKKSAAPEFYNGFGPSREVFLTVASCTLRPVRWASLSIGWGYRWEKYQLLPSFQWDRSGDNLVISPLGAGRSSMESSLKSIFSYIPVTLSFNIGKIKIAGGADLILTRPQHIRINSTYVDGGAIIESNTWGGIIASPSYDAFLSLGYGAISAYCRYDISERVPGSGKGMLTLGLKVDLD